MEKRKVLFISQEMHPYLPTDNPIANISRNLPQQVMEQGYEIRNFMPRFGCINERRHQLHEVIRLSGMNLVINDMDQPLIIKVASIPSARTQVYFIDNEEYFKRKYTLEDKEGKCFEDNDERAVFFARGVFETVKKLGWAPDLIHCHGWMTSLVGVYLKNLYQNEPVFQNTKVIQSLYATDAFSEPLRDGFAEKVRMEDMTEESFNPENTSYASVLKESLKYADAIVVGAEPLDSEVKKHVDQLNLPLATINPEEDIVGPVLDLYEQLIEDSVLAD